MYSLYILTLVGYFNEKPYFRFLEKGYSMILVTGATGLLGTAVFQQFKEHYLVTGTCFSTTHPGLTRIDLTKEAQIHDLFAKHQFHAVFHLVAERQPDAFKHDSNRAKDVTEGTTKCLLDSCRKMNIPLIFISTDYVFDGTKNAPYIPTDATNPLNDYGKSKVAAEQLVLQYPKGIIIRIPVLYGHLTKEFDGAVDSLVQKVIHKTPTDMDDFCKRFPANVLDIANDLVSFYKKLTQGKPYTQIYHYCGPKCFTKFEMCQVFAQALQTDINHLNPIKEQMGDAPRPVNVELDAKEFSEYIGYDVRLRQMDFTKYWKERLLRVTK